MCDPLRRTGDASAAMKVQISDSVLIDDLLESLRAARYIAVRTSDTTVDVRSGWLLPEELAGRELDAYLRVWELRYPKAWAARVN
jgi:hypothetical protein